MPATRFVALPVDEGDAFLFEVPTGRYMIDAGRMYRKDKRPLPSLLERERVTGLTAAICTHTDRDHVDGIIDLILELNDILWSFSVTAWTQRTTPRGVVLCVGAGVLCAVG